MSTGSCRPPLKQLCAYEDRLSTTRLWASVMQAYSLSFSSNLTALGRRSTELWLANATSLDEENS